MDGTLTGFGRIFIAAILGAVVGSEREFASKPAGLRTHIFVAAGSAFLVLLAPSAMTLMQSTTSGNSLESDPVRVIQAIIVGISFLGAGTIVHHKDEDVEGLTTASSIFLTTGIGIAVAVGRIWLAVSVTLFALVVLILVSRIEHRWIKDRSVASESPGEKIKNPL